MGTFNSSGSSVVNCKVNVAGVAPVVAHAVPAGLSGSQMLLPIRDSFRVYDVALHA
jgi:hypothetical protein